MAENPAESVHIWFRRSEGKPEAVVQYKRPQRLARCYQPFERCWDVRGELNVDFVEVYVLEAVKRDVFEVCQVDVREPDASQRRMVEQRQEEGFGELYLRFRVGVEVQCDCMQDALLAGA